MNEQTRNEIVRRLGEGMSQRRIAQSLGIARNTVRRVVAAVEQGRQAGVPHPDLPAPSRRRSSKLDAYQETMQQLLARYPNLTGRRLHEELRTRGFTGGYTIVSARLQQLRPRPTAAPVLRFETAPGAQAQMDYSTYDLDFTEEGRRRVFLFSYVLGYSRRQYLHFVEAQDFATTLREHQKAFVHLGGVAATCLYDNFKVVVLRYEDDAPLYNPRFLAFATHYGFRPQACRPYRPQTKGKCERPFAFVECNLLNGRTLRSLAHLNEVTACWLAEVADVRVHRETKQRPIDRHAEEVPHLLPLPAQPYDSTVVVYRVVNAEGFLAYGGNAYSVPWTHLGRTLPLRITEDEVIIYGPHLEEVARHRLAPRDQTGQRLVHPEHHPVSNPRLHHAQLEEQFTRLGPVAVQFFAGLLAGHRQGKYQAHKVLSLLTLYAKADVLAALERAVRYGAYSVAAVERILAVHARPKTVLEALADAEPPAGHACLGEPVPPRPMSYYHPLLAEETAHGHASQPSADTPGTAPPSAG
jgi:transposase